MVHAACIEFPDLPPKYVVNLPGMGELTFIRDSLSKMPRPSELILKALNGMAPALAPFYTVLKILDCIQAIVNCVKSIKDAVQTMNPGKIIACIEKLHAAFMALLPLFPPLSYVRMVVDIVVLVRYLVQDIVNMIGLIDAQVTKVKFAIAKGMATNNVTLVEIGKCAQRDLNKTTEGILLVFTAIGKIVSIVLDIMDIISVLLPSEAQKQLQDARSMIMQTEEDIDSVDMGEYPALHSIYILGKNLVNVLIFVEQIGRMVVGLPINWDDVQVPELNLENP